MGNPGIILLLESVAEPVYDIPVATSEVREFDRHGAVLERYAAELLDSAPFGAVIHILVERKAIAEAIDETVVHDEVHSSVAANHTGLLLNLAHESRFVGLKKRIHDCLRKLFMTIHILDGNLLNRIFVSKSLVTVQLMHPAVRPRAIHVVLDFDKVLVVGLDQADGMVAVDAFINAAELLGSLTAVVGRSIHRHEIIHLVATVDVHDLADRSKTMGRIIVTAVGHVVVKAPGLAVIPVLCEVVDICSLDMVDLAEQALLCHIKSGHLKEVIAAVFEDGAMAACALRHVNEIPAILDGHG